MAKRERDAGRDEAAGEEILVRSGVAAPVNAAGKRADEPFAPYVTIEWGPQRCQMTPEEARAHALVLLEAAESAVFDAATFAFAKEVLAMRDEDAAMFLGNVRTWRERRFERSEKEGAEEEEG